MGKIAWGKKCPGRSEEVEDCNMKDCGKKVARRKVAKSPKQILLALKKRRRKSDINDLESVLQDIEMEDDEEESKPSSVLQLINGSNKIPIFIGIAVVILIIVAIVLVAFRKRICKKRYQEEEALQEETYKLIKEERKRRQQERHDMQKTGKTVKATSPKSKLTESDEDDDDDGAKSWLGDEVASTLSRTSTSKPHKVPASNPPPPPPPIPAEAAPLLPYCRAVPPGGFLGALQNTTLSAAPEPKSAPQPSFQAADMMSELSARFAKRARDDS